MRFRIERLARQERASFDCGIEELNRYQFYIHHGFTRLSVQDGDKAGVPVVVTTGMTSVAPLGLGRCGRTGYR
jgi:hypothetical protein